MLELLTPAEMARADALAVEVGISGPSLMETAGEAVAAEVHRRFPNAERIGVLCGPGNNGGDGFVAARRLAERGYQIAVGLLGNPEKLPADAAAAHARWREPVAPLSEALLDADVLIDGIFGAGLSRPIEGAVAELIGKANKSGRPIIAIDVPSGIDGATGAVRGIAIRAHATVTFFRRKPGHLLLPGRLHCGPLTVADIGTPEQVLDIIKPRLYADEPPLWLGRFPWPQAEGHKYGRGHAVVVSGPEDATGAARLAARGALRIGAGLVTVASPRDALTVNAAHLTAIMVRPVDTPDDLAALLSDERKNAVVLGPGLGVGEKSRSLVLTTLASPAAVVVDADGLTSFAEDPQSLFQAVAARRAPVVFTPHEGEFARLFPDLMAKGGQEDISKVERARKASARAGAIIVLKGPDTVIAAPDGQAAINATASPWLATAGTGDVLAGMAGGMLAQSLSMQVVSAQSKSVLSPFQASAAAVWLHGAAALRFGPGLISEDLPEMLPGLFAALRGGDAV